MSTQSIDISKKNVSGKCDLKCAYNFQYPESNTTAKNQGVLINLSYDNSKTPPVTYNTQKYTVTQIMITSPSLHLFNGATTDAEIIQLGSSIKPEFRIPYRQGSQQYKYNYITGGCNLACASDMKHGVREWGTVQGIAPLIGCLENKSSFECQPTVIQIYNRILELYG